MRRSLHVKQLIGAMVFSAALGSVAAAQTVPYLPMPAGAAVILNTGSTNGAGYRIVIQRSGTAEFVIGAQRTIANVSPSLASKFFLHMGAAMPLSDVRVMHCMKSASFGSSLFVWWRGQRSPDLSCPGSEQSSAIAHDAAQVAAALGISTAPRGHLIQPLPNEPRKPLPSPAPSR